MKKYDFSKGCWNSDDFMYVYSPICKAYKEFIQHHDCISNSYNEEIKDWDYISIVTKEKYPVGTKVSTRCNFDKYGAPIIVFTDDLLERHGRCEYGLHFEVVGYEDGFNIWHIGPWYENEKRPIKPTKICFEEFKIADESIIDISVEFMNKAIRVSVNGVEALVENEDLPESFHVGITACEGVNKFFDLVIE